MQTPSKDDLFEVYEKPRNTVSSYNPLSSHSILPSLSHEPIFSVVLES